MKKNKKRPLPLSTIFLTGAVIMFWRGTWGLMDVYLFPNNLELSYAVSLLISIILIVFVVRHHGKNVL